MSKELIESIKSRLSNEPYDIKKYIDAMDMLVEQVYKDRYKYVVTPKMEGQKRSKLDRGSVPAALDFESVDGSLVVDFHTYRNFCWEVLEDTELLLKLNHATFRDDQDLRNHLYKTFRNLLQKKIYELSPGLETRRKQIYRVLKTHCLDICREWCRCWTLKHYKDRGRNPANLDQLQEASQPLKPPVLRIPKSGSKYGPSISDKEMEEYLLTVLKRVYGMTTHNNMLSLIMMKYGIRPVEQITPTPLGNDEGEKTSIEDRITIMALKTEGILIGMDHVIMAKQIYVGLDPQMKEIYSSLYLEDRSLQKTADKMGCSLGTIHNRKREIEAYFFEYLRSPEYRMSDAEARAVVDLVSRFIMEEKEQG